MVQLSDGPEGIDEGYEVELINGTVTICFEFY